MADLLSQDRLVAKPGFSRSWIVVAALLINLSVGPADGSGPAERRTNRVAKKSTYCHSGVPGGASTAA